MSGPVTKWNVSWSVKTEKSILKIPDPSKIFVLSYKNFLIKKIFHFEASYYESQHPPLRTSCDTYCFTGLMGKYTKFVMITYYWQHY